MNRKRCLHLTTFPLKGWLEPGEKVVPDNDDATADSVFESEDEDRRVNGESPELAMQLDDEDFDQCPLLRKPGEMNDELADIVLSRLRAGVPYPKDTAGKRQDRFCLHVSRFRDPSFDLGLWYAHYCATQSESGAESVMAETSRRMVARWQMGRDSADTSMGVELARFRASISRAKESV